MTQRTTSTVAPAGSDTDQTPDTEEIQLEIAQTRRELGETVEALSARLDLKSRAMQRMNTTKRGIADQLSVVRTRTRAAVADGRHAATNAEGNVKPLVPIVAVTICAAALAATVLLLRKRR